MRSGQSCPIVLREYHLDNPALWITLFARTVQESFLRLSTLPAPGYPSSLWITPEIANTRYNQSSDLRFLQG